MTNGKKRNMIAGSINPKNMYNVALKDYRGDININETNIIND